MRAGLFLTLFFLAALGCAGPAARAEAPPSKHDAPQSPEEMRQQAVSDLLDQLRRAPDAEAAAGIRELLAGLWGRSSSPTANLLMSRAESLLNSGQGPQAAAILDQVVRLYPDWALAWRKRAQSALMQGDSDAALVDLDHALAADPRDFLTMRDLAKVLQSKGRDAQALDLLRRALELDPKNDAFRDEAGKLERRIEGNPI
jgi:tetratricopeptide (TPR) repeat protein